MKRIKLTILIIVLVLLFTQSNLTFAKKKKTTYVDVDKIISEQVYGEVQYKVAKILELWTIALQAISKKNYDLALPYLLKLRKVVGKTYISPRYHLLLAICYLSLEQKSPALDELSKCLRMCRMKRYKNFESTELIQEQCLKLLKKIQ